LKRLTLHIILLAFIAAGIAGCSTSKNTRATRTYNNVTARYNIYFNGKESIKSGLRRIDLSVKDDFTSVLPLYKESYPAAANVAKADMNNAVLKANKVIQTRSITAKPKRRKIRTRSYQQFASREEFNNWIDDSYLIIGQAYFFQHNFISAIENFSLIIRKFPEEDTRFDAMVWLARSYSEMERFTESAELLLAMQSDPKFPRRLNKELGKANADFYLKQGNYSEAIRLLEITLKKSFWRKEKARLQYILAQLYQQTGNIPRAIAAFEAVNRLNPPFDMGFNARINGFELMAEAGDTEKLRRDLLKMLRDEKFLEFNDQIYYALGNLAYKQGNITGAIENYRKSVAASVDNNFQQALSSVTLADIYFDDKNYRDARAYYDTAMTVIDSNYPNYAQLTVRSTGLNRLVDNLEMVEVQDSLQKLARMPETERNALIDQWIAEERQRVRDAELLANQQGAQGTYSRADEYRMGLGRSDQGGGWYFYNPQTLSFGRSMFQQRWGRRRLEDDWRRQNKSLSGFGEIDEFAELVDSTLLVSRETDPMKRDYYTQDLPLTDSLMVISHHKIRDALYNAGKIFKSDFNDYPRSAESFEELNKRYPENIYLLSAYFDLYDLNELMGNSSRAAYFRSLIIDRYPDSRYARYLLNPNFFAELQLQQDSLNRLYQTAFRAYKSGLYGNVVEYTTQMKQLEPDSITRSKIDFIESVAVGATSNLTEFERRLQGYIAAYPNAEPAPLAKEILTLIQDSTLTDYQRLVDLGYLHDTILNEELLTASNPELDEFGGKYSYDEELVHYFVLSFPQNAEVNVNRLKFDLANYNLDHYTRYDFDVDVENLDASTSLLVIRSLGNKEQALIYFRAIIRNAPAFATLRGIDYYNFVVSSTNYRQITADKSISEYLRFFLRNYSRFIGPDFSDDELEVSPEELMARAEREDELLGEQGRYVSVDLPVVESLYSMAIDTTQNFVVAVMDSRLSLRTLLNQLAEFNRSEFRLWNLAVQIRQAGDFQFVVVRGLPGYNESMSYFRRAILERTLYASLGQTSYRNFLITDRNLDRLIENLSVDGYMEFFRSSYLQRTSATPSVAPAAQPGASVAPPLLSEEPPISGPYLSETSGEQLFVMVVPSEGFDRELLIRNIVQFNTREFASIPLTAEVMILDDFRVLVNIGKLTDKTLARSYLQQLVGRRDLFSPLGNLDYRNFIITPDNLGIFIDRKNISEYMEFYRREYLGQ